MWNDKKNTVKCTVQIFAHNKHNSFSWPVSLNGYVFTYDLSGCLFEFCCCPSFILYHFLSIGELSFEFKLNWIYHYRSFPILKNREDLLKLCLFTKINICKFGKCLWKSFLFLFKTFSKTALLMQITFYYLSFLKKVGFIIILLGPPKTLNEVFQFSFLNTIKPKN